MNTTTRFPITIKEVEQAEDEIAGDDFCICEHQRKSHSEMEGDCARCDCVAFLSKVDASNFYARYGKVPGEIQGSAYTERYVESFQSSVI